MSRRGRGRRNILLNKKHHQRTQLICNSNHANKNLTQATEVTDCALNNFDSWYTSSNLLQAPFFKIKIKKKRRCNKANLSLSLLSWISRMLGILETYKSSLLRLLYVATYCLYYGIAFILHHKNHLSISYLVPNSKW